LITSQRLKIQKQLTVEQFRDHNLVTATSKAKLLVFIHFGSFVVGLLMGNWKSKQWSIKFIVDFVTNTHLTLIQVGGACSQQNACRGSPISLVSPFLQGKHRQRNLLQLILPRVVAYRGHFTKNVTDFKIGETATTPPLIQPVH